MLERKVHKSANFIKGKIGESITGRLFRDMGFDVYPNGFEITQPALIGMINKGRMPIEQLKTYRVRADFIILKETTPKRKGFCFEIEVKYRAGREISKKDFNDFAGYHKNVRFVFLHNNHFWSATQQDIAQLAASKTQACFDQLRKLENDEFYEFTEENKTTIEAYKALITRFYPIDQNAKTVVAEEQPQDATAHKPVASDKVWKREERERLDEEYMHLLIMYTHDEAITILAKEFDCSVDDIRIELEKP